MQQKLIQAGPHALEEEGVPKGLWLAQGGNGAGGLGALPKSMVPSLKYNVGWCPCGHPQPLACMSVLALPALHP